jgi:uncharacterized protein
MLRLKKLAYIPRTRQRASDPSTWKPVPDCISTPTTGVTLPEGSLFRWAMEANIDYLLNSFSVDHLLYAFRERAGWKDAPAGESQLEFWDLALRGSNAGRFLMGATNTLRWIDHAELRRRVDAVVDGIEACRRADGYMHSFPPEQMLHGAPGTSWGSAQESNYARAWITHGLIDAAIIGNPKALPLIRGGHDWFNTCPDLPELNTVAVWPQGHIASTRMYFSPLGRPEDLQVAEKWYVVDEWMDQLAARNPDAIWKTGLAWPHCYNITALEAYLDHYRATGDEHFLDAMLGAWDLLHDHWLHVGGSIAICESHDYPPSSYFIDPHKDTGEFCGSVFWAKFSQRLHHLYPDEEKYATEIEKSIYNVALSNLVPGRGIIYHARLEGQKETPQVQNTCCEGQGTRMVGSLPEFIYSLADDGVYVNLFEASWLTTVIRGHGFTLDMQTTFPMDNRVTLRISTVGENPMGLRVRTPSWAVRPMPIQVNGIDAAMGTPGTYTLIDRTWREGDTVSFTLPAEPTLVRYRGADSIAWHFRYALQYGPILLAVVGPMGVPSRRMPGLPEGFGEGIRLPVEVCQDPEDFPRWLKPVDGKPLHFTIEGNPNHEVMPYWQVPLDQTFTCFPVLSGAQA